MKAKKTVLTELVVQRYSVKEVFLKIWQNSQERTCARVSFLINLQAEVCLIPAIDLHNVYVQKQHIMYSHQSLFVTICTLTTHKKLFSRLDHPTELQFCL